MWSCRCGGCCNGVDVEVGYVDEIDVINKRVSVRRRQSGEVFSVAYDALVVALGSVTDFRAVPGMAEHAIGVRTLGDAFYLRNRALAQLEEAANEPDSARRDALLTFVVVGGGSTGVEVAAELEDLLRTAHRTFASLPKPNVVLVHSRAYVLPEFGDRLGRYATKKLVRAGVRVVLGRRLTRVEPDLVELDDGKVIATATVISTVGNAPNPALAGLAGVDGALDARGWVLPDATFAVPGLERVWALGDCASIIDPGTGRPWPATAQHAVREGPHAARNVLAVLDGRLPTPFDYSQQGMLVSLGRFRGVGEVRASRCRASSPGSCGGPTTCSSYPASSGGSASRSTGRSSSSSPTTSSRSTCAARARAPASPSARWRASPSRSVPARTPPTRS